MPTRRIGRRSVPVAALIGIVVGAGARLALLFALESFSVTSLAQEAVASDECARTAGMLVYSNVFLHKETGDLLGYDLAIKRKGNSGVDALLYVYEGGQPDKGVSLSGQISKSKMNVHGTWVEHLTEYPSKKDFVQKRSVTVVGVLHSAAFRGELTIQGMEEHEQVRLRQVMSIWSCKKPSSSSLK